MEATINAMHYGNDHSFGKIKVTRFVLCYLHKSHNGPCGIYDITNVSFSMSNVFFGYIYKKSLQLLIIYWNNTKFNGNSISFGDKTRKEGRENRERDLSRI